MFNSDSLSKVRTAHFLNKRKKQKNKLCLCASAIVSGFAALHWWEKVLKVRSLAGGKEKKEAVLKGKNKWLKKGGKAISG